MRQDTPYAQPYAEAEIAEMWETHAGDSPGCETCRLLMTVSALGAPGGVRRPSPDLLDAEQLALAICLDEHLSETERPCAFSRVVASDLFARLAPRTPKPEGER